MKGHCLCEAVKFDISGEQDVNVSCYCKHCQFNASAPCQWMVRVKKEQLNITHGEDVITRYRLTDTESGVEKFKAFCSKCGCTLWTIPMKYEGNFVVVRAGLVEGGIQNYPPKLELFKDKWEAVQSQGAN